MAKKIERYFGVPKVDDMDINSVRNKHVLELNSENHLVCRYYDEDGKGDWSPDEVNIYQFIMSSSEKSLPELAIEYLRKYLDEEFKILVISEGAAEFLDDMAASAEENEDFETEDYDAFERYGDADAYCY